MHESMVVVTDGEPGVLVREKHETRTSVSALVWRGTWNRYREAPQRPFLAAGG